MLRATLGIVVVVGLAAVTPRADAQSGMPYLPAPSPGMMAMYGPSGNAGPATGRMAAPQSAPPQYPYLGAPLYPCPQPNIPVQVGGTMITADAFAPHEMMYSHKYKALYPPYYHRVRGSWIWTPFGMESHDKWELQGTEVNVNYRSSYSPLSLFVPPRNYSPLQLLPRFK